MKEFTKVFVCIIVGLFLLLSINPIIYADTKEEHTTRNIDNIFDELRIELNNVESREETLIVYENKASELYKSGLIDGNTYNSFLSLIRKQGLLQPILVSGETSNTQILPRGIPLQQLFKYLMLLYYLIDIGIIIYPIVYIKLIFYNIKELIINGFPINVYRDIAIGSSGFYEPGLRKVYFSDYANGWISAQYSNDTIVNYSGDMFGGIKKLEVFYYSIELLGEFNYRVGITGFTGINIIKGNKLYYMGRANDFAIISQ